MVRREGQAATFRDAGGCVEHKLKAVRRQDANGSSDLAHQRPGGEDRAPVDTNPSSAGITLDISRPQRRDRSDLHSSTPMS